MKDIKYNLKHVEECNMCKAPASESILMGRRLNQSQGSNPKNKVGFSVSIMRCGNCGLIYPYPLPIPESIDDHYGIPPESYWTKAYLEVDKNYYAGYLNLLEKVFNIESGMKALDIGAGTGKCMVALERRGFDVYGIEPSSTFYEHTQGNYNFPKDKFFNKSVETAQFENDFFDHITFGAVLEHLYDPYDAIKKALSWTKKGGVVAIEVPNSDWVAAKLYNSIYKLKGSEYVANLSPMHEPFHIYEFTLKSFEVASKTLPFEVALHTYFPGETYGPKILQKIIKKRAKGDKAMQLYVLLRKI